jgi:mycoredoxin
MPILVYGHETCPMVVPVRVMLNRANVPYHYINIRQNADGAARVRAINNGNETVPTLVFEDGTTLTEPSPAQLSTRLRALGFAVAESTRIMAGVALFVALIGGGLLGLLTGAVFGVEGIGLSVGIAVGLGVNILIVRRFGK